MYSVCYLDITTTVLSLAEQDYLSEKSDACSLSVIVVVRYFRGAVRNLFLPPPPPPGLATCAGPAHSFSPPLSECQRSVERGDTHTQSDKYQHHYKPVSSVRIAPQSPEFLGPPGQTPSYPRAEEFQHSSSPHSDLFHV